MISPCLTYCVTLLWFVPTYCITLLNFVPTYCFTLSPLTVSHCFTLSLLTVSHCFTLSQLTVSQCFTLSLLTVSHCFALSPCPKYCVTLFCFVTIPQILCHIVLLCHHAPNTVWHCFALFQYPTYCVTYHHFSTLHDLQTLCPHMSPYIVPLPSFKNATFCSLMPIFVRGDEDETLFLLLIMNQNWAATLSDIVYKVENNSFCQVVVFNLWCL